MSAADFVCVTHIGLFVPNKLHTVILHEFRGGSCFTGKLTAVVQISLIVADPNHLIDPVLVELEVFIQTEKCAGPA